jgi:hypothetical protein
MFNILFDKSVLPECIFSFYAYYLKQEKNIFDKVDYKHI